MADGAVDTSSNVRRLRPLRVLVSGQDRRFLRVTAFLLAQHGYEVAQAPVADVLRSVEQNPPDVVLLEAAPSRAAAARFLTQLVTLAGAPGVVVVTNGTDASFGGVTSVRKWAPLAEVADALEQASQQREFPRLQSRANEQS